jgi:hypothetical protein
MDETSKWPSLTECSIFESRAEASEDRRLLKDTSRCYLCATHQTTNEYITKFSFPCRVAQETTEYIMVALAENKGDSKVNDRDSGWRQRRRSQFSLQTSIGGGIARAMER